ncbi:MAG: aspartate/tyrosine/aromatic aminotransferase [Pusillimonas sp.]|nr:aspartate/tyrosine/aromatic aminotransferase [Pusillimonas sp.]
MFNVLSAYAGDPILSMQLAYRDDARPEKTNLSIGLYYDDQGRIPRLKSVQKARERVLHSADPSVYLPMSGNPAYCKASQALVFGVDAPAVHEGRVATIQTVGGSGALKVGADVLRKFFPASQARISDPSWDNHRAILEGAGFVVATYPYFNRETQRLDFDRMLDGLKALPPETVVLFHPSCHNPTGADLGQEQWDQVVDVVIGGRLIAFLDMAYQGFGDGLDDDAYLVRALVSAGASFLVANSYSKIFSLYGERCGALSMVCANAEEAGRALGQMQQAVRRNYSSPPAFGASLVETVLNDVELAALWRAELAEMRTRIQTMRARLYEGLCAHQPAADWAFLMAQKGMFGYAPVLAPHMMRLRNEQAVYIIESGRICVADLNEANVDRVAQAFAAVLK